MRLAAALSAVGTTAATIMLAARPVSRSAATTAREVKVVFGRLRRRIRALALVDDLSGSQAAVLTRLHKDGPSSTSVLARAEAVSHQAIGAILAVLDAAGFHPAQPRPHRRSTTTHLVDRCRVGASRKHHRGTGGLAGPGTAGRT